MTATCVICTSEREATYGLLCTAHFERLASMLREVELEACLLDARPSMAVRTGWGGGSLASERSPVRLDVLVHTDRRSRPAGSRYPGPACPSCWHDSCTDIRAWIDAFDARATETLSILDVLHSWARLVREERALTAPHAPTIGSERDLLTRQLEWLADQPFIDEAYADVRNLLGQLKGTNGTADEKPVGRCYLPATDGKEPICNGPIWVDVIAGQAHCGRCRQTWDGPQLALLSFEMQRAREEAARPRTEDGRRMLTAEELVAQGTVSSVNNVRVRAHRLGIVSVNGHYDPDQFAERKAIA